MDLLSVHDPVFVVDLTPQTMNVCRVEFERGRPESEPAAPRVVPERPIRAIALVFAWEEDPVLLSIQPTTDLGMLDAVARLIRTAMLTRRTIATLVTDFGDDDLKRRYFARGLPRFVYDGIPAPVRHRIPLQLQEAFGHGGRRRSRRAGVK
jgi:hypothetical protein